MLQFDHWTGYKIELIFGLVVVIATKVKNITQNYSLSHHSEIDCYSDWHDIESIERNGLIVGKAHFCNIWKGQTQDRI